MKKLSFIILILLIFANTPVYADEPVAIFDNANLFTQKEKNSLEQQANKYYGELYASVFIITATSMSDDAVRAFVDEKGKNDSIVLLLLANENRNYELFTFGKCYNKISDNEVDYLLDHTDVYDNIKSGNYYLGAYSFIELSAKACSTNYFHLTLFVMLCAGVITFLVGFGIYKSYTRKLRSEKYPLDKYCSLTLITQNDRYIRSYVTKTKINTDTGTKSGGSRGGGHRGGR